MNPTRITSLAAGGLVIAACLGLFPAAASAQGFGFGPRVGWERTKDADASEFLFGVALRVKPIPFLGVEGAVDYRQEDRSADALTMRSWPVTVTGLVYPLPMLYAAGGGGWHNMTFDYDDPRVEDVDEQKFGWHVGGGLEIPLGDAGALAADVRYVFLDLDLDQVPGEINNSDFYVISVALLLGSL